MGIVNKTAKALIKHILIGIYILLPFILYSLAIYIILLAHLYYIKMASNI